MQGAHNAGPGSLYQRPAGKLSVAAEPPWTDSGRGRDVDDKVHCLKWFSSDAQLTASDMKAHTAAFRLDVRRIHLSLTPQHTKGSHPLLAVVKRVCGPISVFIIRVSLSFTVRGSVKSVIEAHGLVHPSCEIRIYLHVGTFDHQVWRLFCWPSVTVTVGGWTVRGQVLSMRSPCPEPHSTNSISPLE